MVVALSVDVSGRHGVNAHETRAMTEAARLLGLRVFYIPARLEAGQSADDVLAYVPEFDPPVIGIWVGFIPAPDYYQAMYEAAIRKGIRLVNTPEQHLRGMEFGRFYPLLADLTPRSVMIESLEALDSLPLPFNFPVFVKGAVKSDKDKGLAAVLAHTPDELREKVTHILANPHRSRGVAILREYVPLQSLGVAPGGFPLGREYRVFLYRGEVVAYSFYWDEFSDSQKLTAQDKTLMLGKAMEAARRVDVPYLSVDVGQLVNGAWLVIEIADGQFSGLSQISPLELWSKIRDFR